MTGSVDAWGTVQVPAGNFEALRMHVRGEGEFGISVAGETIILRQVIDQDTWIAPRVGTVANIQMISVVWVSWGQLKNMSRLPHFARLTTLWAPRIFRPRSSPK